MVMVNGFVELDELEALSDTLEDFEFDESDESDEDLMERRAPRRFGRAPRTASGRGLFKPRPQTQNVTQTQLQAAMARVGAQIKTNTDAIKTINSRLATIAADQAKHAAAQRKATDTLRKDLRQTREMSAILPLLTAPRAPETATLTEAAGSLPVGTKVVVNPPAPDSMSTLLPLLLMSGSGLTGGGGDSDSSNMLLLALVLGRR